MVWGQQIPTPISPVNLQSATAVQVSRPKILIGIPYQTQITMYWGMKMLAPLLYVPLPFADKTFSMVRGIPLPVARDQIVKAALADPSVTHICWVDSDNICVNPKKNKDGQYETINPNDAITMLYQCNQPIVSGLYRAKQATGFHYAMWMDAKLDKPGFTPIQAFTGNWLQVDVVGMGFCLVKKEVYEKIPEPWYPWATPQPSEDFAFCIKAKKTGFAINVFTKVQLRHTGDLCVNPDGNVQVLEV